MHQRTALLLNALPVNVRRFWGARQQCGNRCMEVGPIDPICKLAPAQAAKGQSHLSSLKHQLHTSNDPRVFRVIATSTGEIRRVAILFLPISTDVGGEAAGDFIA